MTTGKTQSRAIIEDFKNYIRNNSQHSSYQEINSITGELEPKKAYFPVLKTKELLGALEDLYLALSTALLEELKTQLTIKDINDERKDNNKTD